MRVQKLSPRRWPHGRAGRAATAALLGAVGVALLAWLVVIPATRVQAATYTVNVATDDDDLNAGRRRL